MMLPNVHQNLVGSSYQKHQQSSLCNCQNRPQQTRRMKAIDFEISSSPVCECMYVHFMYMCIYNNNIIDIYIYTYIFIDNFHITYETKKNLMLFQYTH